MPSTKSLSAKVTDMTETYTLSDKLDAMDACYDAVGWSQGKSEERAWKLCNRPDWLLWIVGAVASFHPKPEREYFTRAGAAGISVCIDVLLDSYKFSSDFVECATAISQRLDDAGQGKWRKIPSKLRKQVEELTDEEYDDDAAHRLVNRGMNLLTVSDAQRAEIINGVGCTLDDFYMRDSKIRVSVQREMAREIKRVCEMPYLSGVSMEQFSE